MNLPMGIAIFAAGVASGMLLDMFVVWFAKNYSQGEKRMGVLGVIEKVGDDVLHVFEWPFKNAAELERFIVTAIKEEGPARDAVVGLVLQVKTVVFDCGKDIAADGINLPADLQTIKDLQGMGSYFKNTFLPEAEKVWGELKSDAGNGTAAASAEDPAPASASVPDATGDSAAKTPGLHNTVPA